MSRHAGNFADFVRAESRVDNDCAVLADEHVNAGEGAADRGSGRYTMCIAAMASSSVTGDRCDYHTDNVRRSPAPAPGAR
jgi:hypothetical protein